MSHRMLGLAAGFLGLAAFSAYTRATTIYDSQGFEPPTFHTGNLVGQDTANGPWVQSGTGTAVVQTAIAEGTQAVQVTRQGQDVYFAVVKPVPFVQGTIEVDWDENVPQATGSQPFGPYFGVSAYDALDTGTNNPLLIGSAGIDATTGQVLFQDGGTGFIDATTGTVSFDKFHAFKMLLNFDTQQYQVYVDGALQTTQGFVDSTASNPINSFTDADLSALAANGDAASLAATGSAYYDNYVITQTPEPASAGVMAIAGLLLLRRRRQGEVA